MKFTYQTKKDEVVDWFTYLSKVKLVIRVVKNEPSELNWGSQIEFPI